MWHRGTWFSVGPGSAGLTGGLNVLRDLFQAKLYDLLSATSLSRSTENGGCPDIYADETHLPFLYS